MGKLSAAFQILTPAQKIIPMQMLFLCKHGHHDKSVQVNPLTQHPEIVTAQHVHVEEMQYLAANLQRGGMRKKKLSGNKTLQ